MSCISFLKLWYLHTLIVGCYNFLVMESYEGVLTMYLMFHVKKHMNNMSPIFINTFCRIYANGL